MLSRQLWKILGRLPMPIAAAAANAVYSDRDFLIDDEGDWECRLGGISIVSPTAYGQRLSSIEAQTAETFLPFYVPEKDHFIVDVGAGIGEEVLALAHRVSSILAIEAHPVTFRCLSKTIRLSHLDNVELLECAVSDQPGTVMISTEKNHLANTIGNEGDIPVPSFPLNQLCRERGRRHIDFLKVNIEGAEALLLEGLEGLSISNLAISCHDFVADRTGNDFFRTKDIVRSWLVDHGYETMTQASEKPWIRDMIYGRSAK